jgi:hypothetical protein
MRHEEILGLLPHLNYLPDHSAGLVLFLLELLFWTAVLLLTLALVRYRPTALKRAELRIGAFSEHKRFWLFTFCVAVVVIRVGLLPWVPVPVPVGHDEFSYLLGADTFAHGRLTNPASPMWVHFESFSVNMRPTYQSMYPPGQGLALALGQKLTGVPWVGVVLSVALMCSAIYWMLLGWLPAPWAWLGGVFAVLRFGIFSYWINSYWGGAVAALGGALVLGALPRLRTGLRTRTAIVFACGLLILAISRPLEGLLFSLPTILTVAVIAYRSGRVHWRPTVRSLLPAVALLVATCGWILYYNWRGTGKPLLMPYVVNFNTYHISKPFLWQKPNPIPTYRHQVMRTFYVFHELPMVLQVKYEGAGLLTRFKANVYYAFFLWPFMLMIAPALYAMWRNGLRPVLMSVALLAADLFAQIWPPHSHYAAPATGAIILMALVSLRHFRNSHPSFGFWASRAVVILMGAWMLSPIAECLREPFMIPPVSGQDLAWMPADIQRERIKSDLKARGGKHLVIVHHPWHYIPSIDWVYNEADLDHAPVIWARDMGYLKNKELLEYYPDRQVWYVDRGDMMGQIWPMTGQLFSGNWPWITPLLKLMFPRKTETR